MRELVRKPVLVLNANYEPIHVCSARRAITLVLKGIAHVEELSGFEIRSSFRSIPLPSVVRLQDYRKIPRYRFSVSRKNILTRDRNTCQYCNEKYLSKDLTLDHIIPRSRGGKSTWDNLVCSCLPCNARKGSRTPEEANMPLKNKPREANCHTRHQLLRTTGETYSQWQKYLFY